MENVGTHWNWTEIVENLVDEGDIEKAISVLESVISKQDEAGNSSSYELVPALLDLSKLYADQGLSLKADETRSRAIQIRQEFQQPGIRSKGDLNVVKESSSDGLSRTCDPNNDVSTSDQDGFHKDSSESQNSSMSKEGSSVDDDWEAIVDRAPDELLPATSLSEMSKLTLDDDQVKALKRRGRGTFSYGKHGLYSDEMSDKPVLDDEKHKGDCSSSGDDTKAKCLMYGTRHVLVLADFPLSTRTADLEKVLEKYKDSGIVIRWVNDTVALAVFRSPSTALEACQTIQFPFPVRVLHENDELLQSISQSDLEPPRVRPKTSARTAQRIIAQSMGIRLPSSSFGSRELKEQEAARKNRIVSRQNMRDEAWGDDDTNYIRLSPS